MVAQLGPDEALAAQRDGATLVDVREQGELARGRIPGAIHAPLSRFHELWMGLPDGPLVCICAAGTRSDAAARFLAQQGRTADNLAGGIIAWARAGLPIEGP